MFVSVETSLLSAIRHSLESRLILHGPVTFSDVLITKHDACARKTLRIGSFVFIKTHTCHSSCLDGSLWQISIFNCHIKYNLGLIQREGL
jgi:hypothetical protein